MTESKFSTTLKTAREQFAIGTTQVRESLAGRSKQVVGIVALAGIAGIGITAASVANPSSVTPEAVASTVGVTVDRQNAADRANRDSRADASKSPSAKATTPAPGTKSPAKAAAPATTKAAAPKPKYANPLPGAVITSCYGQRWGVLHAGIDFAADENTPIHAVVGGTVTSAGWAFSGYGISVVVDHGNGYFTHYAHMNKAAVKVGQKVAAGAVLGYEGSTGDSTGPHLHFEVHKGMWNQINPASWLAARGISTGC
ncbi:murein DD-endopeptidase MepM/ murein hydrolase activator NlpD [Allocatelliglobosispora scoriae]|uniref:Murein DD-endopeptidase MepM/ murein hydrolase activator NlpD n=1 Tax=Allocatelliglobosispora scoriae TaxID=643052 RepID=A0A841BRA8_9ACTN|nr:M23 family metallopeptidase [Allocatelliglobosispora scoriae]MBB5871587.1 murein DD-endopeptidase MepM/ murein hydrolase activator NlpD [Allocatelliglobosispora scoriae]